MHSISYLAYVKIESSGSLEKGKSVIRGKKEQKRERERKISIILSHLSSTSKYSKEKPRRKIWCRQKSVGSGDEEVYFS